MSMAENTERKVAPPACGFKLVGYVVMPEHVHLLISEPKLGTPSTDVKRNGPGGSAAINSKPRTCATSTSGKCGSESITDS